MPSVKCPFPGCDYVTDDVEATIVVALLEAHTAAHKIGQGATKKTTDKASKDSNKDKPETHTGHSKSVQGGARSTFHKSSVKLCYSYNGDGCDKTDSCPYLHLCKGYIEGKCTSGKGCSKSHNILEPRVKEIMEKHGIDTSRRPKEILPDLQEAYKSSKVQGGTRSTFHKSSVKLCYSYNGAGCDKTDSCPYLHLCKGYIEGKCTSGKGCSKSHNILEPRVKEIMEKHGIDTNRRPKEILPDLQEAYKSSKEQSGEAPEARTKMKIPLQICFKYNTGSCDRDDCHFLHLCKGYIESKCDSGKDCSKSHNILETKVKAIMEEHDIDTKRKPRDILPDLQAAVKDSKSSSTRGGNENSKGADKRDGNTLRKKSSPKICYNYNGRGCEKGTSCPYIHMCRNYIESNCELGKDKCNKSHNILESEVKAKLEKHGIDTKRKPKDILADFRTAVKEDKRKDEPAARLGVKVNGRKPAKMSRKMVCYYNLRGNCKWNFCPNIHCDLPYQWRWRPSISEKEWSNLGQHENVETEKAFCDPVNQSYMLITEQGVNMNIDFNTMTGTDMEGQSYIVHRVSTPSSVELTRQPWATVWLWYWKNETGIWLKYGDTSIPSESGQISNSDIEQAFINNPDGKFSQRNVRITLDFSKMMQIYAKEKSEIEICRRPLFISEAEAVERKEQRKRPKPKQEQPKLERVSSTVDLSAPPNWNVPSGEELSDHRQLVMLKESEAEYKEIKTYFLDSLGSIRTFKITSIERIENGDLWENFVGKRTKMLKKKTKEEVGERRLFHGTRNQYIIPIWHQGFDFRLSGQTSGTVYGKGSYFATTSKYSNSYVEQTTNRAMFVVKALPGAYVRGISEYKRPPHKDKDDPCSELYDSCVDSESNPQIFVIFDNNQIYPEYLIRYEYIYGL